jgi:acyl-CoA thioesterase-1
MHYLLPLLLLVCCATLAPSVRAEETLLILGDSLSANFGMRPEQSWVALLEARLRREGLPHSVVNVSLIGETTQGGLARLPKLMETHRPSVVVVELGANDGLLGQSVDGIRGNLKKIVTACKDGGARVLLVSMRIPPNFGPTYVSAFRDLYGSLADEQAIALSRFLLDGVAGRGEWMMEDGVHPLPVAQATLLDNVWPALAPLIGAPSAASASGTVLP